jgi:hypothetical protein
MMQITAAVEVWYRGRDCVRSKAVEGYRSSMTLRECGTWEGSLGLDMNSIRDLISDLRISDFKGC